MKKSRGRGEKQSFPFPRILYAKDFEETKARRKMDLNIMQMW